MSDKLVKLFSLNLNTSDLKKKKRILPKGDQKNASDVSHSSSNEEKQSNSILGSLSIITSTSDSYSSIKTQQLNPYKRVNSLSEYVYKFKKLASGKNTALEGNNIFRKFNTNQRQLSNWGFCKYSSDHSRVHSGSHSCIASCFQSCINSCSNSYANLLATSTTNSREGSNSHFEFKSIPSGTSDNDATCNSICQEEGHSRNDHDSSLDNEIDNAISPKPQLLCYYKKFKSHMTINSSPLSSYLNTICHLNENAFNETYESMSNFSSNFSDDIPPFLRTDGKWYKPGGHLKRTCWINKTAIKNFLKRAREYNETINGNTQNDKKKVRKIYYKNKKICVSIQMNKLKNKKIWKELTYKENKKLMKNLRENKNYIYNKKNKNCLFRFFLDYIISSCSEVDINSFKSKRKLLQRHVDRYITQFVLSCSCRNKMFLACRNTFEYGKKNNERKRDEKNENEKKENEKKENEKKENERKKDERKKDERKKDERKKDEKKKAIVEKDLLVENEKKREEQKVKKFSSLLANQDNNIILGNGNILFPGCRIISKHGHIHIGDNNLFEDNVTIINCTYDNMYIGNYNIFRSGTYITNVRTIGDQNYFDYKCKCTISNSNIGCCSYIRANLFRGNMNDKRHHYRKIHNTVTDMPQTFLDVTKRYAIEIEKKLENAL
ncbi:dynactin subunit 6 [Plasmodium gonderi]|uniref:Dynactin subunit 6 n=1 Tax=Plasmodium gonderi TaxID=77519 RepID=A0A1Y1JHZ5_PLAGO|nr:dynactin subunit 6 [Plasmodium gonderi]GAW79724.1 dynactin subunit 6 [Plasmodium gonderi]